MWRCTSPMIAPARASMLASSAWALDVAHGAAEEAEAPASDAVSVPAACAADSAPVAFCAAFFSRSLARRAKRRALACSAAGSAVLVTHFGASSTAPLGCLAASAATVASAEPAALAAATAAPTPACSAAGVAAPVAPFGASSSAPLGCLAVSADAAVGAEPAPLASCFLCLRPPRAPRLRFLCTDAAAPVVSTASASSSTSLPEVAGDGDGGALGADMHGATYSSSPLSGGDGGTLGGRGNGGGDEVSSRPGNHPEEDMQLLPAPPSRLPARDPFSLLFPPRPPCSPRLRFAPLIASPSVPTSASGGARTASAAAAAFASATASAPCAAGLAAPVAHFCVSLPRRSTAWSRLLLHPCELSQPQ